MNTATYLIEHPESGSRVFVEFALCKGTGVRLASIGFVRGNVVSLNAIRDRMPGAYNYLISRCG